MVEMLSAGGAVVPRAGGVTYEDGFRLQEGCLSAKFHIY